ncbi:hypothetical protein K450DRAFT_259376 [Umbelopsis ramanniana AG]|uniref:Origin recognition complex subunit 5 n=1 Tax=Umbelopsis ramanniana AG TaxID=1314678 RepID=A0AAD5E1V9_UMBRA|nr:uncharacterized protein K450DRAFT_259376 [Umbelopsis ramanniana AG]KAI8575916.1 hypothetical protein K450DRAFT_259376 [Umbelopsis ramanniana AG]
MNDMADHSAELKRRFPGRSDQIDTLLSLMGRPADPTVPSILIYGHSSSGKTSLVRDLLSTTIARKQWAYINCIERHTPRMMFEHAVNEWCSWSPSWDNQFTSIARIDNLNDFLCVLKEGVPLNQHSTEMIGDKETRYLVLDRAERLRDMGATILPALLRLSEISQRNICVILLSTIVYEKFRTKSGSYEPLVIRFPEYSKEDTLQILRRDFSEDGMDIEVEDKGTVHLNDDFFRSFSEVIYSIFFQNCKDLNELRHLVALLFPLFINPIRDGRAKTHETAKLFKLAQPYFAEATDKLYLREISSSEWAKRTSEMADAKTTTSHTVDASVIAAIRTNAKGDFDLPYYTKFLLIASYLASYNPPRFDVRYFAKVADEKKKKKRGIHKSASDKSGGKMRQQLLGPKAFPVERMLAIFYSIIDDKLDDAIDIPVQITSLTTLRLLLRTTNMDKLDGAKYKCNVSFDFIRGVARSVRFEIDKYLFDFI